MLAYLPCLLCRFLKSGDATMEQYVEIIKRYTSESYTVLVSDDDNTSAIDGVIKLRTDVLSTCPLKDELRETFTKRLQRKQKKHGDLDMSVVAVACLGSVGYSVGHVSLSGVTDKEMCKIWGILEKTSVSSSYQLRQWITPLIDGRTCEGYIGYWEMSRSFETRRGNEHIVKGSWESCKDITKHVAYKMHGQPETVLGACEMDIKMFAKCYFALTGDVADLPYL